MLNDFATEYSQRSDDELLQLASDRASLMPQAATALDSELRRRNLTASNQSKHQKFVKHNEQREAKRRRRKVFGTRRAQFSWVDLLCSLLAMALISFIYLELPIRFHMKPDWQEAAVSVMFASVFIAVSMRSLWRKIAFWISLVISSPIHLIIVHAWVRQHGELGRGVGKLAILLGFGLFFALYGVLGVLQRSFYGEEARGNA